MSQVAGAARGSATQSADSPVVSTLRARRAATAAGAIAALALAGCASATPSRPAGGGSQPASASSSATAGGQSGSAQPTAPAGTASPAAGGGTAAPPPAGALTAAITILGAQDGMLPGGPPMHFAVTVTNHSAQAYANILPLVSLGHCTCTASTLFPAGTIQERESTSNVWQIIPFVAEGFGTDFLQADEPGGIQSLSPGGVATFEYRMALSSVSAAQSAQLVPGTGTIDVTLLQLPGRNPVGPVPSASVTVHVMPGALRA
jgi:hypothetical protein